MGPTRIAVFADTHLTDPNIDSQSLFPRQLAKLLPDTARRLYEHLCLSIAQANYEVLNNIVDFQSPMDMVIHLGDFTGGWQERGMCEQSLIDFAKREVYLWRYICSNLRFCLGGHDTGYTHPGSLPGSGMSYRSLISCAEIFGDLWWFKRHDDICLLGICSSVAAYTGNDPDLLCMRKLQENAVAGKIAELSNAPWILFAHEPFLPKRIRNLLKGASRTCKAFIHGHRHDPKYTKFFRALGIVTHDPFLRISNTCPSVAPLWWPGCGWMEVTIENHKVTIQNHQVPVPESIAKLPTASFLRCLWWMLRPG